MIVELSGVYAVECIHRDLTAGVSRNLCTIISSKKCCADIKKL